MFELRNEWRNRRPALLAKTIGLAVGCFLMGPAQYGGASGVGGDGDGTVPGWVREHLAALAQGSGRWIASNAAYVSEHETADEYGMEWSWTLGQQGVRGRLFGLRDGEELGTFWELHSFWHPAERRLVAQQFAADGTVVSGSVRDIGDDAVEVEQTVHGPDGQTSRILHRSKAEGDQRVDRSFVWRDGAWQPRRSYIWVRTDL